MSLDVSTDDYDDDDDGLSSKLQHLDTLHHPCTTCTLLDTVAATLQDLYSDHSATMLSSFIDAHARLRILGTCHQVSRSSACFDDILSSSDVSLDDSSDVSLDHSMLRTYFCALKDAIAPRNFSIPHLHELLSTCEHASTLCSALTSQIPIFFTGDTAHVDFVNRLSAFRCTLVLLHCKANDFLNTALRALDESHHSKIAQLDAHLGVLTALHRNLSFETVLTHSGGASTTKYDLTSTDDNVSFDTFGEPILSVASLLLSIYRQPDPFGLPPHRSLPLVAILLPPSIDNH
jgi:hypothetical protein